jgi:hypothetical protein
MSSFPEYLDTLLGRFKEDLKKISAKEPEIVVAGEGKQYRSTLTVVAEQTVGFEKIHKPDKSGFVVFSRAETRSTKVAKCNIGFPIYVPARKSHAWPGIVSIATLIDKEIPNTIALVRIGWRKKLGFIPVLPSFSKDEEAYGDQLHWDRLTKSLNLDNTLLQLFKVQKWDGGMMELELHIKAMSQLIPYKGKAIVEHSFLPKPSGNVLTGYRWEFGFEERLKIIERLVDHLMATEFSGSAQSGRVLGESSLATQDIFSRNGEEFYSAKMDR